MGGSRPPYGVEGYSTRDASLGANDDDRFGTSETPRPWFLKPWVLALWGLAVLLLIATIIYGLVILATGNGGAPATTRPSTTTPSSTAPSRTTTPSSTLPTTTTPPETSTEELPPVVSPTWTQQHPHHHWRNGTVPQIPGLPPIHMPGVNP